MAEQGVVEQLREQLIHAKKAEKRAAAADALGELGEDAAATAPELITSLDDDDDYVRISAAHALGNIGSSAESAITALFHKVITGDSSGYLASIAIAKVGMSGIRFLIVELQQTADLRRSVAAAYCLYNFANHPDEFRDFDEQVNVSSAVEEICDEKHPEVLRNSAALVAGAMANSTSLPIDDSVDLNRVNTRLLKLMSQPNFDLALTAAVTLGFMGEAAFPSVPSLIRAVVDDEWWAPYAVEALEEIDELASKAGKDMIDTDAAIAALDGQPSALIRDRFDEFNECYSTDYMKKRAENRSIVTRPVASADGVSVLGVHPVRASVSCFLIELIVLGSTGEFDIGEFGQAIARPKSHQVAYDERFLTDDGKHELVDVGLDWPDGSCDLRWVGDVRLAFFVHHLDLDKPLETPFGPTTLTSLAPRPKRLRFLKYETP